MYTHALLPPICEERAEATIAPNNAQGNWNASDCGSEERRRCDDKNKEEEEETRREKILGIK